MDTTPWPVWDPAWLRRSYDRCLWDGRSRGYRSEFCSSTCELRYDEWEAWLSEQVEGRFPELG